MAMGRGVATGNDDPNSDDENEHNDPDDFFRERNGNGKAPPRSGSISFAWPESSDIRRESSDFRPHSSDFRAECSDGRRESSLDFRRGSTATSGSRTESRDQYRDHGPAMSSEKKLHYHLDEMQAAFQYTPSDVQEKFLKAQKRSQRLQSTPNFQEQMILYSLLQQSTLGDPPPVDHEEFSDIFGAPKREAWLRLKGRPKQQTMKGYISYVEELGNKYGWLLDGEKISESLFDASMLHSAF